MGANRNCISACKGESPVSMILIFSLKGMV